MSQPPRQPNYPSPTPRLPTGSTPPFGANSGASHGARPVTQSSFGPWGAPVQPPADNRWAAPAPPSQAWPPPQQPAPSLGRWGPPPREHRWQPPTEGQYGQPSPAWPGGGQATAPPRRRPIQTALLFGFFGLAAIALIGGLVVVLTQDDPDVVAVEYQNEDYVPPQGTPTLIPYPTSSAEMTEWLESNSVYSQQIASPVNCGTQLESGVPWLAESELELRFEALFECMTRVWGPTLEAAGWEPHTPGVTVFSPGTQVNSPCGTLDSYNAYWCSTDQEIYMSPDLVALLPNDLMNSRVALEATMSHEYGHALQGRIGIMGAAYAASELATDTETFLEISRRQEMQADCLGAESFNSLSHALGMSDTERQELASIRFAVGTDQLAARWGVDASEDTHGSGRNRQLWTERGLESFSVGTCNTFLAPTDEVN